MGGVGGSIKRARAPSAADVALLWAGASPWPDPRRVAEAANGADPALVMEAAARHRVASLVLRAVEKAGCALSPERLPIVRWTRLREAHTRVAIEAALQRALDPLEAAGLRPMVLKGLSVLHRYPHPFLRPMDDIDLLLPRPIAFEAARLLASKGWRPAAHRGRDPRYDLLFTHASVPGVALELHYEFTTWRERPPGLETSRLWSERVPTNVMGRPAWGLPPELELLVLVVHATKRFHLLKRLIWMSDVALVASTPGFDWGTFDRLASEARRRVAAAVSLAIAERLGARVPDELLQLPRPGLAEALAPMLDPARPFEPRPQTHPWVTYALIDDVAGRARLAVAEAVRPSGSRKRGRVLRELARVVLAGFRHGRSRAGTTPSAAAAPRSRPSLP